MFQGFGGQPAPQRFDQHYSAYPVSFMGKEHLESGGKILLPSKALDMLARMNITYPMLFKLTNKRRGRSTHCGVLEFSAEPGKVFMPYWMMQNLLMSEGDTCNVVNVTLPKARFAKFQPQSKEFHNISNPKAVLENVLRNFACLTKGDIIQVSYNNKKYELCVLELKPADAVSIIETDMEVDFAPLPGEEAAAAAGPDHGDQSQQDALLFGGGDDDKPASDGSDDDDDDDDDDGPAKRKGYVPFGGAGARLNGQAIPIPTRASGSGSGAALGSLAQTPGSFGGRSMQSPGGTSDQRLLFRGTPVESGSHAMPRSPPARTSRRSSKPRPGHSNKSSGDDNQDDEDDEDDGRGKFKAFSGKGYSLK